MTKVTLTLPEGLVDALDEFAEEFEEYVSRSEIVEIIVSHVLEEDAILEELFPEDE